MCNQTRQAAMAGGLVFGGVTLEVSKMGNVVALLRRYIYI